ncbi:NAD(P)/FAD-dependent oxidoreductase [Microbacterium sp. zg.B48]|uniref:flavin-containing monooxygenase n=1 Tax=unclassified Microbacterium TaxID=2609290 RepID=UPI00214C4925|nr:MULTISPECIES: NAD(P)/FAD-dependent oxidoreductase [unclassified Microbacterium]MCR2764259.1 NAD(P)/FAD-dependent oxidoreductase [Microbacterium sp. zg.B48]MCR2810526.1 NAD(P)/FAD-dependent oxidoreductase [Microbacterium sp. zg.B185]WIM19512.1 NAD(P)/FAD-dependent oxidoreductase [Microbacterium sp. zg-B185]
MSTEETEVVIVGAGQAGIAMSEHLTASGIPHIVFEKERIAEKWRSGRWDSLVANGPAWHDRFPGRAFEADPDCFISKEEVADYFVAYAAWIGSPVRTGVEVTRVHKNTDRPGFTVETSEGRIQARFVVSATGAFQRPRIPAVLPAVAGVTQLHSADYKNPAQLPAGSVLVVGAGSSGVQIAAELQAAGRPVYLSVGAHDRPPRRYRGRDNVWWLGVLGKWDMATPPLGAEHVTIAVSGADGGRTVDFRDLAAAGITLVGRTESYRNGVVRFSAGLRADIENGDADYLSLLREADDYIARNGLELPEEPEAHVLGPLPRAVLDPVRELDLAAASVRSIVWATGYAQEFGWLQVDTFDDRGRPQHARGVAREPGVYFLGLPWLSRRGSSFIWGVWHDAKYVADQIQIQRGYAAYRSPFAASSTDPRKAHV